MMDKEEFRQNAHNVVDWMADYFDKVGNYPVKSQVKPGEIIKQLKSSPSEESEDFKDIFEDFEKIIMPGLTHWQHPKFFGYFPANNSYPSILAEMLTATLGLQCMIWQTSPAAAELEENVLNWLAQMIGLPTEFHGVIQDTASTATLCSILTAREKFSNYDVNKNGYQNADIYRVYCSTEAHSSIEKAVKIAGIGYENLRKINVDDEFALIPEELESAIEEDIINGFKPLCVVAALGTTGSVSFDPLLEIGNICKKYNIWLHVDAAYAGSALILPEMRWMIQGIELADTFVFNPHKWLFTNFDCSAYFIKDKEALIRTFEIMPEYLKTAADDRVNNYRDWGIPLGRRFRALKLWFVIRSFGVKNLQEKIKFHIKLANDFISELATYPEFEILAPVYLNVICFRFCPDGISEPELIDKINHHLHSNINRKGKIFITHTKLNNKYTLRFVIAQTNVEYKHVKEALDVITEEAEKIKIELNLT